MRLRYRKVLVQLFEFLDGVKNKIKTFIKTEVECTT